MSKLWCLVCFLRGFGFVCLVCLGWCESLHKLWCWLNKWTLVKCERKAEQLYTNDRKWCRAQSVLSKKQKHKEHASWKHPRGMLSILSGIWSTDILCDSISPEACADPLRVCVTRSTSYRTTLIAARLPLPLPLDDLFISCIAQRTGKLTARTGQIWCCSLVWWWIRQRKEKELSVLANVWAISSSSVLTSAMMFKLYKLFLFQSTQCFITSEMFSWTFSGHCWITLFLTLC